MGEQAPVEFSKKLTNRVKIHYFYKILIKKKK
jgi:hypothetical protein